MSVLESASRKALRRVAKARRAGNDVNSEWVTNQEFELIENLVGAAFVVGQAFTTRVAELAIRIEGALHRDDKPATGPSKAAGPKKNEIAARCRQLRAEKIGSTGLTVPEAVHALANYFKHREQWPRDWSKAGSLESGTIDVIQKLGANSAASDNLAAGLENMGYQNYDLSRLGEDLHLWAKGVRKHYADLISVLIASRGTWSGP
ncbi:MAG: hypothetical protein ABSH22_00960 [Tepidisphaeraceae bacterium]